MTVEQAVDKFPIGTRFPSLERMPTMESLESKTRTVTATGHGTDDGTVYVELEIRETLPTHDKVVKMKVSAQNMVDIGLP